MIHNSSKMVIVIITAYSVRMTIHWNVDSFVFTEAHQCQVYTLQPFSNQLQSTVSPILSQQQQQFIHQQQELKGAKFKFTHNNKRNKHSFFANYNNWNNFFLYSIQWFTAQLWWCYERSQLQISGRFAYSIIIDHTRQCPCKSNCSILNTNAISVIETMLFKLLVSLMCVCFSLQ